MSNTIIVHHKANLDPASPDEEEPPPNSQEAVRASLEANAPIIEVDINALARDDYLLIHDETLESTTTGTGPVINYTPEEARALYIKPPTGEKQFRVTLLSDVIRLFQEYPNRSRLQLDFKNVQPFNDDTALKRLVHLIKPLGERVQVSSPADWQLRKLHHFAPWLDLGFDIKFYLDWRDPEREFDPDQPPVHAGAYGYQDDHVLAHERVWPVTDYLQDRCETLARQVRGASTFYIRHTLLLRSLDDGFNWMDCLHTQGCKVDAWTVDADDPCAADTIRRLSDAGLDQITTNTPRAMADLLAQA